MFKPTIEHLEELMRAKEICESISDEMENEKGCFTTRVKLQLATQYIEDTMKKVNEALE